MVRTLFLFRVRLRCDKLVIDGRLISANAADIFSNRRLSISFGYVPPDLDRTLQAQRTILANAV
jgi:hypothetical protein